MNLILKSEKLCLFVLLLYIYFFVFNFSVSLFFVLFFIPDLSMIGYMFSNKIGAIIYNTFHSYILPTIILVSGMAITNSLCQMVAIIWIEHILFDRMIGYGLKYFESFKQTHLS